MSTWRRGGVPRRGAVGRTQVGAVVAVTGRHRTTHGSALVSSVVAVALGLLAAACSSSSHATVATSSRRGHTVPPPTVVRGSTTVPTTTTTTSPRGTTVPPTGGAPAGTGPFWLINNGALQNLVTAGLPASIQTRLNSPKTLLVVNGGRADPRAPAASLVQSFTNLTSMQQAFASGQVPPSVSYVMLDLEQWSFTPLAEQLHPFQDAQSALQLAHRYGRKLIFTPAVNLAPLQPGVHPGDKYQKYLSTNFAGQGAAVSDIFEIQAQQSEATPGSTTFAVAAVRQAKAAAPIPVLVGIGTNPAGRSVTAQDIAELANSVKTMADGYWLNIPQGGAKCPACGIPQPAVAVQFLQMFVG